MLGNFTQNGLCEELAFVYRLQVTLEVSRQEVAFLTQENGSLKQTNTSLRGLNEELHSRNDQLSEEVESLKVEIKRLQEQLALGRSVRFGSQRETGDELTGSSGELLLITVRGHTRRAKSKGRLMDTSLLPRHRVYHDLTQSEKTCGHCQRPLKRMGEDVSEQIEVLPQRLYVVEHVRYKYTGCDCHTVKMAPKPFSPLPKALAGASLLTEILENKYHYHLPLYRQSKLLASYQAIIPDNTLGHWVMEVGAGLTPIYNALFESILIAHYLQVDETPVQVLKPNKKGYVWSYFAPHVGKGIVVFEFNLTRSAKVPEARLKLFKGALQTDAYAGYRGLRGWERIVGFGCLTHSRRKFADVLKASKNPEGIAAQMIERLKPVYALEARMKEAGYSFHTRKRLRQRIAWPLLKDIHRWLKSVAPQVPPNSLLGTAIHYTLTQWPYLVKYVRHGMVEIDTNGVENKIRDIALGRRNWLFMGNEKSGAVHALFYSLLTSCLLNGLNPRLYLHYILLKIHDLRRGSVDPKTLLPHTIDRQALQAFAQEQITQGAALLNSFAANATPPPIPAVA